MFPSILDILPDIHADIASFLNLFNLCLQIGYFSFGGSTVIVVFQKVCPSPNAFLSTELHVLKPIYVFRTSQDLGIT